MVVASRHGTAIDGLADEGESKRAAKSAAQRVLFDKSLRYLKLTATFEGVRSCPCWPRASSRKRAEEGEHPAPSPVPLPVPPASQDRPRPLVWALLFRIVEGAGRARRRRSSGVIRRWRSFASLPRSISTQFTSPLKVPPCVGSS